MPSSYTSSLRLVLPVTGELDGTWGDVINAGLTPLVEDAIAGTAAVAMSDANYTLTTANEAADEARCMFITLTGALTAQRNVVCPSYSKLYVVTNNTTGGFGINFKTSAGTGVVVPAGERTILYCDGTDVLAASTISSVLDQGTETDVASAATTDIGDQTTPFLRITGTTGITSFGTAYQGPRYLRFAGALLLTHNATTLVLPGAANITTAAGDRAILTPIGNPSSGWQVLAYQRASGQALLLADMATARIKGRVTAGSGQPEDLTGAQAQSLLPVQQARVDVASATTTDLTAGAPNTDHVNITGTTAITGFTVAAGRLLFVRFNASLTLTNSASIVTQAGANIVTQAGDTCVLRATAANVVEVLSYVPAVLNQQTTRSMVRLHTSNGYGSTNICIMRFTTTVTNQGADITYADSATLGASFTINTAGVYSISQGATFANSGAAFGVSLNSASLSNSIGAIAAADRLTLNVATTSSSRLPTAIGVYLPAGSVLRPHADGSALAATSEAYFTITRMA